MSPNLRLLGHLASLLAVSTAFPGSTFSWNAKRHIVARDDLQTGTTTTKDGPAPNWYIDVEFGTPPQPLILLPDTGSNVLSVQSALEHGDFAAPPPVYDPNSSSTANRVPGETYSTSFGGNAYNESGEIWTDTVSIGTRQDGVTIENMYIQVQTFNSDNTTHTSSSPRRGTIGFAPQNDSMNASPNGVPCPMQQIMPQLKEQLLAIDFNPITVQGTIDFGFIDDTKYTGQIGWEKNQDDRPYWLISLTMEAPGISLRKRDNFNNATWLAVFDSGDPSAIMPLAASKVYWDQVPGSAYDQANNQFTYPCNLTSTLPDMNINVGGQTIILPGPRLGKNNPQGATGTCTPFIGVAEGDDPNPLLGQPFIEEFFFIFRWSDFHVGIANRPTAGSTPGTSSNSTVSSPGASSNSTVNIPGDGIVWHNGTTVSHNGTITYWHNGTTVSQNGTITYWHNGTTIVADNCTDTES